mmetsp:Transcript_15927/g.24796  ORF Transcript_15927/g.24796 Transcript_15927/m.24796 type:complete len:223 (+) Transcript_15927:2797-3465(+)
MWLVPTGSGMPGRGRNENDSRIRIKVRPITILISSKAVEAVTTATTNSNSHCHQLATVTTHHCPWRWMAAMHAVINAGIDRAIAIVIIVNVIVIVMQCSNMAGEVVEVIHRMVHMAVAVIPGCRLDMVEATAEAVPCPPLMVVHYYHRIILLMVVHLIIPMVHHRWSIMVTVAVVTVTMGGRPLHLGVVMGSPVVDTGDPQCREGTLSANETEIVIEIEIDP